MLAVADVYDPKWAMVTARYDLLAVLHPSFPPRRRTNAIFFFFFFFFINSPPPTRRRAFASFFTDMPRYIPRAILRWELGRSQFTTHNYVRYCGPNRVVPPPPSLPSSVYPTIDLYYETLLNFRPTFSHVALNANTSEQNAHVIITPVYIFSS